MGYDKYYIFRKQVSFDSGDTWNDVIPIEETPSGDPIGSYSTVYECEGRPVPPMYTWRQVDNEFICEGAIKYYKQYKQVSTDGGTTWQDVSPAVTKPGDIKHYGSAECLGISATTSDYLTFYAVDNCTFHCYSSWSYSIDGGEWINYYPPVVIPATVSVQSGHTISMRIPENGQYPLQLDSSTSGRFIAYGNAYSACMEIEGVDWDTVTPTGSPRRIFSSNSSQSGLTDASMLLLPARNITERMYEDMFIHCVNMVLPPELPATNMAYNCYNQMFYDCTSLETVPLLPATTLADYCYDAMFENCTSLETLPNNFLPVTNLSGCTGCYRNMFARCHNLRTIPNNLLPATTLADSCYAGMFRDCSTLNNPPALPATNLENACYAGMFNNCMSLSYAPSLPATTLADYCYDAMFFDCRSLIKAPDLSASTLVYGCYYEMFYGCYNLTELKCLATSIPSDCSQWDPGKTHPFQYWLKNVYTDGGVLYKKSEMDYIAYGERQIPGGWQQVNV